MTALTDTAVHQPSIRATTAAGEALLQIEAVSRQYGPAAWGIHCIRQLQRTPPVISALWIKPTE